MRAGCRPARWKGRILTFSVIVCALAGPFIGCVLAGILRGWPLFFLATDPAYVPVCEYAFISFGPLGLLGGALGGWLCLTFIDRGFASRGRRASLMLGFGAGGTVAFLLVSGYLFATGNPLEAATLGSALLSGGICGLLIAAYAYRWAPRIAESETT